MRTEADVRQPAQGNGRASGTIHAFDWWAIMDGQTKREIWLLAVGTALVELPVAFAAFTILSH
jgi:hypothetical protein